MVEPEETIFPFSLFVVAIEVVQLLPTEYVDMLKAFNRRPSVAVMENFVVTVGHHLAKLDDFHRIGASVKFIVGYRMRY